MFCLVTVPIPEVIDANIALDREAELLGRVSRDVGQRFLWIWTAPPALVAPRKLASKPGFAAAAAASTGRAWPVHLRGTGGDVTPQGKGIVNVSHVYTAPGRVTFDLEREYDRLCSQIETALGPGASRGWMPGAFCDGAHNVQFDGRKFAGTAMRFRPSRAETGRYAVLSHALMLIEPPKPDAIAAINAFLRDLNEDRIIDADMHTGLPGGVTQDQFLARLWAAFARDPELADVPIQDP